MLLPPGDWYDYWTGLRVAGAPDAVVTVEGRARVRTEADAPGPGLRLLPVTPVLEVLPVFVRAGAIIPRQPLVQSTGEVPDGPLQLHVYPGPDCHGTLYLDDGTSFAHRGDGYLRSTFRCERMGEGLVVRETERAGAFQPWWREIEVVVHDAGAFDAPDWQPDPVARTATAVVTPARLADGILLPRVAAGDAALRALRNPMCNPLPLPDGKYADWGTIDMTFDPKIMMAP